HYRPSRLRSGAFANAFDRRILVGSTGFAPAAIRVLATLQPIAPAQNPVLGHVVTDSAQSTQHLPRSVDVIDTPTAIPRTIIFLGIDQVSDGPFYTRCFVIKADV